MDQRGEAGGEADAAELPSVPSERGAARSERDRLQPEEPLAAARVTETDRHLATDESAATPDEDGWPAREARPVLLAAAGRRAPDAASIWGDRATACGAVSTGGIADTFVAPARRPESRRWARCPRNRLPVRPCQVWGLRRTRTRLRGGLPGRLRTKNGAWLLPVEGVAGIEMEIPGYTDAAEGVWWATRSCPSR